MKNHLIATALLILTIVTTGCINNCPTNTCKGTPAKEKSLADYWAFYEAKDPCANDRACSIEEKRAYALLGYKAAKCVGLTPTDPKTGLTALETPIKYLPKGPSYKCPEGTCSATAPCPIDTYSNGVKRTSTEEPSLHSHTGYLLTAFDTSAGPRFVILKADEEFEPGVSFNEAAGTYESVAKTISEGEGNIAVFLTAFPLIETENNLTARLPNDFDVKHIRSIAEKLGKRGQLLFKKWN